MNIEKYTDLNIDRGNCIFLIEFIINRMFKYTFNDSTYY